MSTKKTARKRSTKDRSLRIIGGQWRGRKLSFPDADGLRPTGDRLRETLFNWLAPVVVEARCLDLFAGSGALGLEAISRGARSALLVEKSARACNALQQHRQLLGAQLQLQIVQEDALQWLQRAPPHSFDIVFLDPPFNSVLLPAAIASVDASGCLCDGAHIYVESPRYSDKPPQYPGAWQLLRSIETGQVLCQLFELREAEPGHNSARME